MVRWATCTRWRWPTTLDGPQATPATTRVESSSQAAACSRSPPPPYQPCGQHSRHVRTHQFLRPWQHPFSFPLSLPCATHEPPPVYAPLNIPAAWSMRLECMHACGDGSEPTYGRECMWLPVSLSVIDLVSRACRCVWCSPCGRVWRGSRSRDAPRTDSRARAGGGRAARFEHLSWYVNGGLNSPHTVHARWIPALLNSSTLQLRRDAPSRTHLTSDIMWDQAAPQHRQTTCSRKHTHTLMWAEYVRHAS